MTGIVGPDGGPWAGDTTGAFFFDAKGTTEHGYAVTPIVSYAVASDRAEWPVPALVPDNGLFHPSQVGSPSASDGDVWWLMWEGNPGFNAGRPHPLGILVEGRALGWNSPTGLEDIIFVVYTFYNITSLDQADYLNAPAAMRSTLVTQAREFHALNNTAFGITLPTGGYSVTRFHTAIANDFDVSTDAGSNYAGVTIPMSLAFTWHEAFPLAFSWTFDPGIFSPPFFAGAGFVGSVLLRGPDGSADTQAYSNTINGGAFGDAQNTTQLYRYLSGNMSPAAGDAPCNNGDPTVTRVCYVNNASSADIRDFHSTPGVDLAPGQSTSLVMAYLFAAPVADPACQPPCSLPPGDRTIHGDPTRMAAGVPDIDKLAGYVGFSDADGDGVVTRYEYRTVPLSLYGKAQLAQAFFDNRFLVPQAPQAPEFFLIPGDDQVTVMWRPSASERTGDPFFDVARDANRPPPGGGPAVANPLYDPNYREFDVEGYRIYRGRVDDPDALELVAQFDYIGTTMDDFGGQINVTRFCAPELAITTQCPITYDSIAPGLARSAHVSIPLDGRFGSIPFIQVRFGDRSALPDGSAIIHRADTTQRLFNTGVPFLMVDDQVRNSFRYFYAVTAFDVNSWQSGPASLESPRITKAVVPVRPATNYDLSGQITGTQIEGRGVVLDHTAPVPTIDPATGIFSGPMPPADGWDIKFTNFLASVLVGPGSFSVRLDSIHQGNPVDDGRPNVFFYTALSGSAPGVIFTLTAGQALSGRGQTWQSSTFAAVAIDNELASRFGGDDTYSLQAQASIKQPGVYQTNGTWRGAAFGNSSAGADLAGQWFDGPRWFDGDPRAGANESFAHPTQGNCPNNCNWVNATNAGSLSGVTNVHHPMHYMSQNFHWRAVAWANSGAARAADVSVFWGAGGTVDSVIDITHNVEVPFRTDAQGSWGFLTFAGQAGATGAGSYDLDPSILTKGDVVCVAPLTDALVSFGGLPPCFGTSNPIPLVNTATIGPMGMGVNGSSFEDAANYSTVVTTGFMMYLVGNWFSFDMPTLPAAGSIWTMRDYMGAVFGGEGRDAGGNPVNVLGPYSFEPQVRPMTAVGVEMRLLFDVVNQVNSPTADDIANVHPVPDPFYFRSDFDQPEVIRFINLPQQAIIRIYSASGVLVTLLEHASTTFGGEAQWNVRNRGGTRVAPGVYFYHIESNEARRVGRMLVVSERR